MWGFAYHPRSVMITPRWFYFLLDGATKERRVCNRKRFEGPVSLELLLPRINRGQEFSAGATAGEIFGCHSWEVLLAPTRERPGTPRSICIGQDSPHHSPDEDTALSRSPDDCRARLSCLRDASGKIWKVISLWKLDRLRAALVFSFSSLC